MTLKTIKLIPEWAPQDTLWLGWPCVRAYWGAQFEPAQAQISQLVRALAPRIGVVVGVRSDGDMAKARQACGPDCDIRTVSMGDIWFRDTGPIFAQIDGALTGLQFAFNGWGGKYVMAGDEATGADMLAATGYAGVRHEFVLEGGAVDFDGAGRLMTTRACVLNPNRNSWTESQAEAALKHAFGVDEIIWLDQGLAGDHTDGHVDNIARFIEAGRVVCQTESGENDPNSAVYQDIQRDLETSGLDVISIPSPGKVLHMDGTLMAASHLNFVFANGLVVMPRYEAIYSEQARLALASALPDHEIIALDAGHVLTGGGSFHCISQQIPVQPAQQPPLEEMT